MAHRSDRRGDTPTTGAGQTGPYQRLASPRAFTIVARSRACSLEGPKIRLQSDAVPPRRMRVEGDRNQLLQRPPPPVSPDAGVQRRERLGGLLNFYHREAA